MECQYTMECVLGDLDVVLLGVSVVGSWVGCVEAVSWILGYGYGHTIGAQIDSRLQVFVDVG